MQKKKFLQWVQTCKPSSAACKRPSTSCSESWRSLGRVPPNFSIPLFRTTTSVDARNPGWVRQHPVSRHRTRHLRSLEDMRKAPCLGSPRVLEPCNGRSEEMFTVRKRHTLANPFLAILVIARPMWANPCGSGVCHGGAKGWGLTKISRFFFPSPATILFFLPSLWGSSRGILVFEASGP